MPFNVLFFNHWLYSKTSYNECGVTISIDRKKDEIVYFFLLDNTYKDILKKHLGIEGEGQPICDLLVFYQKEGKPKKVLCLAEAKGSDTAHALKQIENIYDAMSRKMKSTCKNLLDECTWVAYIQQNPHSSSPPNMKSYTDSLEKKGLICRVQKNGFSDFIRKSV